MPNGFFNVPKVTNEPKYSYAPGTKERENIQTMLRELRSKEVELPMFIGGEEVYTNNKIKFFPPHDIHHCLGVYNQGDKTHVKQAVDAALAAKEEWANTPWHHRVSIFLKAADLISGRYRDKINAATMLGQSKNVFQAEIDACCELVDFFRFGAECVSNIYKIQPSSAPGMWNYNEFRPLEGFVFALTPFNFTAIAGNLPAAPAMLGNVVVWKPSKTSVYSASIIMEILREAGLPDGVINLVYASGPDAAEVVFDHPDFAGFHFTGSTGVFQSVWATIGKNITKYKTYPRIVGETGGKDYIISDHTANPVQVATAIVRGAYEFQGQKCSAASRAYIAKSLWSQVEAEVRKQVSEIKVGPVEDFTNFVNAVIDESSFDKLKKYIDDAKESPDAEVIIGGGCDKSKGYFVQPTVILAKKPDYVTMVDELFGPVITIYVFEDDKLDETLTILDQTSIYALTGAIFSKNRYTLQYMTEKLKDSAGNFYINDKPTGSVVGQQPFGGSRGSGTNDKAGSIFNYLRWTTIRTVKECFDAEMHFMYPNFLPDEEPVKKSEPCEMV